MQLSGRLHTILPTGGQQELPPAIGSFTTLHSLDISSNRIKKLIPELVSLQSNLLELNISNNLIENVAEIANLTRLLILSILNKPIKR